MCVYMCLCMCMCTYVCVCVFVFVVYILSYPGIVNYQLGRSLRLICSENSKSDIRDN